MRLVSSTARDTGWILAAAILVRLILEAGYGPARFADSGTYIRFAEQILSLDLSGYDGWRTPGYPVLLAAVGLDERWVAIVQAVLGIATTLLLYFTVLAATGSRPAGVAAALAHTLALNQLFLESAVLAETLACFLVVLVMSTGLRAWQRGWRPADLWLVGATCAAAVLVRPLYVVVGGVVVLLILFFGRGTRMLSGAVFLGCFAVPLLFWFTFNKVVLDYFGMTTLLGYNLTNHSGAFMEKAPAEYATIREIYLKHRDRRLAEGKSHAMTIFEARNDLKAATGLGDAQLSREFLRLSLRLFADHPGEYLASVARAWGGFWAVPSYWKPEDVRWREFRDLLEGAVAVQKWVLRAGYAAFLVLALPILWIAWIRKGGVDGGWNAAGLLTATVLAASLLQALLEYGENARYALPTQSIAMAAVIIAVALLTVRGRRAEASAHGGPATVVGER